MTFDKETMLCWKPVGKPIFIIFNKEGNFTNLSYMSMFVGKGIKQSVNNIVNRKIIENH